MDDAKVKVAAVAVIWSTSLRGFDIVVVVTLAHTGVQTVFFCDEIVPISLTPAVNEGSALANRDVEEVAEVIISTGARVPGEGAGVHESRVELLLLTGESGVVGASVGAGVEGGKGRIGGVLEGTVALGEADGGVAEGRDGGERVRTGAKGFRENVAALCGSSFAGQRLFTIPAKGVVNGVVERVAGRVLTPVTDPNSEESSRVKFG